MKFVLPMAFSEPTHACEMARAAEAAGWEAVTVSDHTIHPEKLETPYPYTPDGQPRWESSAPWPDPMVLIGAMSAVTSRIRFLTNVYVLPLRNPFTVAKTVGTAAVVSGGRVGLGIGMGWMEQEFRLLEQPFRRRGKRADEMIEVLRKLWRGEMVEHQGEFYEFPRLVMRPGAPGPIPIYVGGFSKPALRRAARLGDGWVSDLHDTAELAQLIDEVQALRREYGTADRPFEIIASVMDAFDVDGYRRLEDLGVTHLMTMPWVFYGGQTESLDDKLDGIKRFADDVIQVMA